MPKHLTMLILTALMLFTLRPAYSGLSLPQEEGRYFATSGICAMCHTGLQDEAGTDVSIDSFWRSTLMANSARDPYWQATVRSEVLIHPQLQAIIEDKCATCHMPMARFTAYQQGQKGKILDQGFLDPKNALHALATDGVSCTVCHQIRPDNLGDATSFSGKFIIDAQAPAGERTLFGPYAIAPEQATLMQSASGFLPAQGLHIRKSALCATCHTLYTPTLDKDGNIVGAFPEQTPYLEWRQSVYAKSQTCQGCHMPHAQGGVQISLTGGQPRQPFSKHVFVGGNAYMLKILKAFGDELGITATGEQFEATLTRTLDQLQKRTATLSIANLSLSPSTLTVDVVVRSQVGHKFPTGFPARRAWLHLLVQDADGNTLFESGGFQPDGAIKGNDNDKDPARYEPHYQTITHPEQVQIYEAIIKDAEGELTTVLLRGAGYSKDNRLLPLGLDKETAPADIAVQGKAATDQDFLGGSDRVRYVIDVHKAPGPFTVTAELLYQSIGYRWAENLRRHAAPEITRFHRYYATVPNTPTRIARVTARAGE